MNARSIRFRLTAWYAGLLAVLLILFGGFIYIALDRFLESNLSDALAKDAQTIGESWIRDIDQSPEGYAASEIEEHFAPSITGRFVRVTRQVDKSIVYWSNAPESGAFDPKRISPKRLDASDRLREEHLPDGKELLIFKGHHHDVWRIAFSPDSKRIASASRDNSVKVWDATTGQEIVTFMGHLGEVWAVAFCPDGKRVASIGRDAVVRVWDASNARELYVFDHEIKDFYSGHPCLAFSPDGKRLATIWDNMVNAWNVGD